MYFRLGFNVNIKKKKKKKSKNVIVMVIVTDCEFLQNPWHSRPTYSNPWKFYWWNMWYVFEMCDTSVMCVWVNIYYLGHFWGFSSIWVILGILGVLLC